MSQKRILPDRLSSIAAVLCAVVLVGCQTTTPQNGGDPEQAARTRTAIAAEYIKRGDLDAAKQHLQRALQTDPRSAEANNMMAILLQSEGSPKNMQLAEQYYRKAIHLKDDYAQAHNNYGVYLTLLKRYPEAIRQFDIAGTTLGYEGRAAALENLGRAALRMDDTARAQQAFEGAIKADNTVIISRLELAEIFLGQGRVREASSLYDSYLKLLGRTPQSAQSLWLGMRLARLQQQNSRVQAYAQELAKRYPDSAENQRYQQIKNTPGMPWK